MTMTATTVTPLATTPPPGICDLAPGEKGLFDGAAFNMTAAQLASLPEVMIALVKEEGGDGSGDDKRDVDGGGDQDLPLPIGPAEYMVRLPDGSFRLGITRGDCIIGDTHMLKYWTVYDRANKRMGFAPLKADKCLAARAALL